MSAGVVFIPLCGFFSLESFSKVNRQKFVGINSSVAVFHQETKLFNRQNLLFGAVDSAMLGAKINEYGRKTSGGKRI